MNSQAEVSAYTAQTLNKLIKNGLMFSCATARTAATVIHLLKDVDVHLPVILMNGALIYDIKRQVYTSIAKIEKSCARKVILAAQKHDVSGFAYTIEENIMQTYYDKLQTAAMRDFYEERVRKFNKQFTKAENLLDIAEKPLVYFSFLNTHEKLQPLYEELSGIGGITIEYYQDIYHKDLWYLEILSDKASKYTAAMTLKEQLGADKLVGFGDNFNDIPLFNACDECYAVSNANDKIKSIANAVIGSNNDDGVVKFLEALN